MNRVLLKELFPVRAFLLLSIAVPNRRSFKHIRISRYNSRPGPHGSVEKIYRLAQMRWFCGGDPAFGIATHLVHESSRKS